MDTHPDICAPAPPHLLTVFPQLLHLYGDLDRDDHFHRLAEDMLRVVNRQMGTWRTTLSVDRIIDGAGDRTFGALFDSLYSLEASQRGKKRYLVKDNGVCQFIFFILALFPGCQLVYLVRDVRDVVSSWLNSDAHFGGLEHAARIWAEEQQEALQAYSVLHGREKIHLMFYENLIEEPERALRELCAFLGETFHSSMLDFHATEEAKESAARIEAWKNLSRPFITSNRGKYRTRLSKQQISEIEKIAGREMEALGYSLDFPAGGGGEAGAIGARIRAMTIYRYIEAGGRLARLLSGSASRREVGRRVSRLGELKGIEKGAQASVRPWKTPSFLGRSPAGEEKDRPS